MHFDSGQICYFWSISYISHVLCSMESNFRRMTFWLTFNKSNGLLLQFEPPFFDEKILFEWFVFIMFDIETKKKLIQLPIKDMQQTKIIKFTDRIENISKESALNY